MGSTDWVLGSCCHHYPHALCRQVKPGDREGVTHIFDSLAVESKSTQVAPLLQLCWQRWSTQTLALGWQTTGPPNALLDRKTRQKGFLWWQMQVHNNTPSKAPHTIANWFKQEEQAYHHNKQVNRRPWLKMIRNTDYGEYCLRSQCIVFYTDIQTFVQLTNMLQTAYCLTHIIHRQKSA